MTSKLLALAIVLLPTFGTGADSRTARQIPVIVSTSLADLQPMVGKTVGEFLDSQRVTLKACAFGDEPPGVLRFLSFATPKRGERLVLTLRRDKNLFDPNRKWKHDAIRGGVVARIEIEKLNQ